jgi:electron transfer flavoprotein alpha subunit
MEILVCVKQVPEADASILTIQPGIFTPVEPDPHRHGSAEIKSMTYPPFQSVSLGLKQAEDYTTGIAVANIIVAAGRGICEN